MMKNKFDECFEKTKHHSHGIKKKCKKRRSHDRNYRKSNRRQEEITHAPREPHKKKCNRKRERRSSENRGSDSLVFDREIKEECLSEGDIQIRSTSPVTTKIKKEPIDRSDSLDNSHKRSTFRDRRRNEIREDLPDDVNASWGKKEEEDDKKKKPVENKAKPDFGLSGKLVEETNVYNGVVIKYSEPEEARKPKVRWRLYPFKGETALPVLYIHRQSAYLIGRDRKIADLAVDHPSCSKQHAVLQYRLVSYTRPNGSQGKRVRPYVIDLESANGTYVNNKRIDPRKYVELLERDVIKFAYSSREYVLLHEHSKDDELDEDVAE